MKKYNIYEHNTNNFFFFTESIAKKPKFDLIVLIVNLIYSVPN
mgnify:FL=1